MIQRLWGIFRPDYHDIIECLTAALEAKDHYTSGHSTRVADMSFDLARALGLKGIVLENVHLAAHLHDIGKMAVPESILNKIEKLLPHEWAQIQLHPEKGYNILSKSKKLIKIAEIVLYHHERWDGKGYPHGLKGEDIPLGARIIGVADAIDAMTTARPYRLAMSWEDCRAEVRRHRGIQFDPMVADAAEKFWVHWERQALSRVEPLPLSLGDKEKPLGIYTEPVKTDIAKKPPIVGS